MNTHSHCNVKMETLARINNDLRSQLRAAQERIHELELMLEDVAYSRVSDGPKVALASLEKMRPATIRVRKAETSL
jgi:hypothetical protein